MMVRSVLRWLLPILCLVFGFTAHGASPEEVLAEANAAFATANESALSDPARAGALYADAARKFDFLARELGIRNGELYLNLGNACFLAGDMGQAVLAYRRAEQLLPGDSELLAGLAHLRAQRIDSFPQDANSGWWRAFCFWHYHLDHGARTALFALAYIGLFAAIAGFLYTNRDALRYVLAGCAIATLLLGSSLLLHRPESTGLDAVITAPETVLRKGDSYIYEPAFTNPLHAGTELRVYEQRGDWALAELPGEQRAWIERAHLEFVEPTGG